MMRAPWVTHFGFTHTAVLQEHSRPKTCSTERVIRKPSRASASASPKSLLGVITGEVGVGKTVAVRAAISQLDQAAHHIVYLANPTVGTRGLYVTIVQALGAVPRGFKAELIAQTQTLLAAEEHERRRRVVLVIDEAHLLGPGSTRSTPSADQRRDGSQYPMLGAAGRPADSGASTAHGGLCRLGSTRSPRATRSHPMDLAESAEYLRITWLWSGRTDPLIADDAIARLHKASLGLPRALNNAAIAALIAATTAGKALVDDDCAKKAVAELTRD